MAHPMKGQARDNNPKWMNSLTQYVDGEAYADKPMADMPSEVSVRTVPSGKETDAGKRHK